MKTIKNIQDANRKHFAKLLNKLCINLVDFKKQFNDVDWRYLFHYQDRSLDKHWRGNGNKAKRRMGMDCVPFSCSCSSSPCQHEHYYETGTKVWFQKENGNG